MRICCMSQGTQTGALYQPRGVGWTWRWEGGTRGRGTQTHVCRVSDAIQPSHPLSSPSPPAPNPSQHQWKRSAKAGLKLNIQKTKIMASGPITSWQLDGETLETVTDFILGGSKITADGDCSHEIKRCLLLGRKANTNLHSILKQRHYFAIKGPSSQRHVFPVVMYGCESLTIKKAEHWRIDAFVGEDSWASRSQGDPTSPS